MDEIENPEWMLLKLNIIYASIANESLEVW